MPAPLQTGSKQKHPFTFCVSLADPGAFAGNA